MPEKKYHKVATILKELQERHAAEAKLDCDIKVG